MPKYCRREEECYSERDYESCCKSKSFRSILNPKQEVMFVLSKACGKFRAKTKGCILYFKLDVFCIDEITQATIQLGCPNQDGPIVAFLLPCGCPTGKVNGTLSEGHIDECDLVGPLKGKSIQKLFKLMEQGRAYINVYTKTYPEGEIRGQVGHKY